MSQLQSFEDWWGHPERTHAYAEDKDFAREIWNAALRTEDLLFRTLFMQAFGSDALPAGFTVHQAFEFMWEHIPMPESTFYSHRGPIHTQRQPPKRLLPHFCAGQE